MRKHHIVATSATLAVLVVTGCSSATDPGGTGEETSTKTVINVWSWQSTRVDKWNEIFEVFEEDNPEYEVVFTGYNASDYATVLGTGLSAPRGPDIAMMHPYSAMYGYVAAEQLIPIDDIVEGLDTNFDPSALLASQFDGVQYGVPFAQQSLHIYYNKTLFDELDVTPPESRDEWIPLLDTIKAAGVVPIAMTGRDAASIPMPFDVLVGDTYGGAEFIAEAQAGDANWNNPDFIAALDEFQKLLPYFPAQIGGVSNADAAAMLGSGAAAMFPGGTWELAGLKDLDPDFEIGVFTLPSANPTADANPAWGYEDGSFALSAMAENPEGATKLLNWMATLEFGQLFTDILYQPSSVLGAESADPVLQQMIVNYQANPVPMIWVTDYFGTSLPAPYAALMNGAQALVLNSATPDEVAADIQGAVEEWNAR